MEVWLHWSLCIGAAYVIGSIPFGVLIGKARGTDIRAHGSRNIGATNVGRVLGRPWGILCFVLDVLKGAIPVLFAGTTARHLMVDPGESSSTMMLIGLEPSELTSTEMWLWLAVAAASICGHMASVFLRFAGGKGVATSFGAMLAMYSVLTWPAIGALVVWYTALRLTRYISAASMLSAVSLPLWYVLTVIPNDGEAVALSLVHASPPFIVTTALSALVIWRHRANIGRLRRGEEPKAGRRIGKTARPDPPKPA